MLFGRKNHGKHKSTRDLDQGPSETTQVLNTHTRSSGQEIPNGKTLDDIGNPPPPPSSERSGERRTSYSAVEDEEMELVPYNDHVHETAEAELPADYERKLVFGDDGAFGYGTAGEFKQKDSNKAGSINKEITPSQAKRYFERMDSKVKKLDEYTKSAINDIKASVKDDMKHFKEMIDGLKQENKKYSEMLKHYKKLNSDLARQNKEMEHRLDSMKRSDEKMRETQAKNENFIHEVKKSLEPYRKREEELLKWCTNVKEAHETMSQRFSEVLRYAKDINSTNEGYRRELDRLWEKMSEMEGKLDVSAKESASASSQAVAFKEDIEELAKRLRHLDSKISEVINAGHGKKIDSLERQIQDIEKESRKIYKELGKQEQKVNILRERINVSNKGSSTKRKKS